MRGFINSIRRFLARLRAAGAAPEEIDIVLCTHLHSDHVGWNTMRRDGRWVPTFPNAKYLFSRAENEYGDPRRNPQGRRRLQRSNAYRDSVLPVIEHGQAELIDGTHAIDDGLLIEPAPGHTVGHIMLKLTNGGRTRAVLRRRPAPSAAGLCAALELGVLRDARRGARDAAARARILRRGARVAVARHISARRTWRRSIAGRGFVPEFVEGQA